MSLALRTQRQMKTGGGEERRFTSFLFFFSLRSCSRLASFVSFFAFVSYLLIFLPLLLSSCLHLTLTSDEQRKCPASLPGIPILLIASSYADFLSRSPC